MLGDSNQQKYMSHGTNALTQGVKRILKKTVRNDNVKVYRKHSKHRHPLTDSKWLIKGFATDRSKMSKELDCRVSLHLVSSV